MTPATKADFLRADVGAATRQEFMHKLEEGYLAYTVVDGKADTAIREFDPEAQRIVMTPALVGG